MRYLTELRRGQRTQRLDVAGAITVTAGLGALIYAIVGTDTHPWGSSQTLTTLAVAVVLLAAFAVIERRVASAPLVPFGLFRSRSLTGANLVMLLVGAAFFSMWYFLSLYLQNVLRYDALRAGLAFFPMAVSIIIGAQISSRLLPRLGSRPLLITGTVIVCAGFAWLSRIPPVPDYWGHVFGPGCLISLALGLLFTPLAAAGTAGVPQNEAGLASGVLNTSRQIGGSLGLAVLATVATDHTTALLQDGHSAATALTSGYGRAFTVAAGLGFVAFLLTLVVPSVGRSPTSAPADAEGPSTSQDVIQSGQSGRASSLGTEPA